MYNPKVKRRFDLIVVLPLILFFAPVMLITAIAIRLTSRGPALFSQIRVGKCGKPFHFLKFRTMYNRTAKTAHMLHIAELAEKGVLLKTENDPRITPLGKILRRTSLDELPQLLNVFRGDMSLVGPRPLVEFMVQDYELNKKRFSILPGITGYWQIYAREKNNLMTDMLPYDLLYIQEQSLSTDAKILIRTIPAVLSGQGAV